MAFTALKNIIRPARCSRFNQIFCRSYSLWEPDYLAALQPKIPLYPTLNIQIRGYDFPIVEKFQGFVHDLVVEMDMDVESSWPMPPKEIKVKRLKPKSDITETEYHLNLYERNVQISNASNTTLPVLVKILEASLPMGMILNVEHYDPEKELKRYVPDTEMINLKSELEEVSKD